MPARDPFDLEGRITPRPPDAQDDLVFTGLAWEDRRVTESEKARVRSLEAQFEAAQREREARQSDPSVATSLPPPHVLEGEWPANIPR